MTKYNPPALNAQGFHCPHCGVHAQHVWSQCYGGTQPVNIGVCQHCKAFCLCVGKSVVFPDTGLAPPPHEDMPDEVKADYEEARGVLGRSPKAAAALLRLSIQRLMPYLGEKGKDINADIGSLVDKGLRSHLQKALDTVRIVGNESVHPGTMDVNDSPEVAKLLFELVNMLVNDLIAEPKKLDEMYKSLPEKKLDGIEKRDK